MSLQNLQNLHSRNWLRRGVIFVFLFYHLLFGVREVYSISWWVDFLWAGSFRDFWAIQPGISGSCPRFLCRGSCEVSVFHKIIVTDFYVIVLSGIR